MTNVLSDEQIEQFIQHGYIKLEQCFDCTPGSVAHRWVEDTWARNGLDKQDQSTWPIGKIHMPGTEHIAAQEMAPNAVSAILDLCGGADRIIGDQITWGNGFIANYGFGRDQEWEAPSADQKGWHKDGDFFRHFLDSPEQALLTIIVFSDIGPQGGGTFIAPDSIKHVAEYLLEHPEGVLPDAFSHAGIIKKCSHFVELTAKAGDVVLLHPYMMHRSSFNHSERARFIINPCCKFKEPMRFQRADGAYSPVERGVLHALGLASLDFHISHEREAVVPGRLKMQAELLKKEQERLKGA